MIFLPKDLVIQKESWFMLLLLPYFLFQTHTHKKKSLECFFLPHLFSLV